MEESSRSVSGVGGEAGAAVQVEYPAAAAARAADEGGSAKKGGVEGADLGTEEKVERKAHKTASKGSLRKTHGSKGSWD